MATVSEAKVGYCRSWLKKGQVPRAACVWLSITLSSFCGFHPPLQALESYQVRVSHKVCLESVLELLQDHSGVTWAVFIMFRFCSSLSV